jgi:hypothetical protein
MFDKSFVFGLGFMVAVVLFFNHFVLSPMGQNIFDLLLK